MSSNSKKIILDEKDIPKQWYNIQADLPEPLEPPYNVKEGRPATAKDFEPIFTEEIIKQEMSTERFIDIPEQVLRCL